MSWTWEGKYIYLVHFGFVTDEYASRKGTLKCNSYTQFKNLKINLMSNTHQKICIIKCFNDKFYATGFYILHLI